MKKIITIAFIIASCIGSIYAQEDSKPSGMKSGKKDAILLNFYTDVWQRKNTSMTINKYSPGFDVYAMTSKTFGKSKFSLGFGLGIGTHNMRSDAIPANDSTGKTIFTRIPDSDINSNKITYDNNKLTLTYFDIPIELRYKAENKKGKMVKFSIGAKAGYLLSSHTKYKGTKYLGNDPDVGTTDVKYKTYKIKNLELLRYGLTMRFGYGMYNIFGYYSLTKLFKKDKGPEMYPISVGICLTPL